MMLLLVLLSLLAIMSQGQECLQASSGNRPLPEFEREPREQAEQRINQTPVQAIIQSYRFNCCGVITGWGTFAERPSREYMLSFEVWRPGEFGVCYDIIGTNEFQMIQPESGSLDSLNRGLVNVSIASDSERITVQPGDVIGFSISSQGSQDGILLSLDPTYNRESVWIGRQQDRFSSACLTSAHGPLESLNAAPLITATVETTVCSQVSSTVDFLSPMSSQLASTIQITRSTTESTTKGVRSSVMQLPTPTPTEPGDSLGLTIGVAGSAAVLLVFFSLILCIPLCVVIVRRFEASKHKGSKTTIANSLNKAAGRIDNRHTEGMDYYDRVLELSKTGTAKDKMTTGPDTNIYTNEGLGGAAELRTDRNEAYGVSRGAPSDNEPSIPTTENEAYTSVSTERVEGEEMYDTVY